MGSERADEQDSVIMVRLDGRSRRCLARAASLRGVSLSDYVRTVTVPQARREVRAADEQVLAMTPEEQLSFWNALSAPATLTRARRRLGAMMRGES
jgi:uncharacterized protein (DUF1778 family)